MKPFTYDIMNASSFTYHSDLIGRIPPDDVVEHLATVLTDDERFCIKALFGMPEMSKADLEVINAICMVSQDMKLTPLTFMKMMEVNAPLLFTRGFKLIAEAWQHEGKLPKEDIPSVEELNQQFEM